MAIDFDADDTVPAGMVHDQQMLRLYIRGVGLAEPTVLADDTDVESDFGVLVANEMGLWRHGDLPSIGRGLHLHLAGPGANGTALRLVETERENEPVEPEVETEEQGCVFLQLDARAKMRCKVVFQAPHAPVVLRAEIYPQGLRDVAGVCSMPLLPAAFVASTRGDVECLLRNAPEARQCRVINSPVGQLYVAESTGNLGIGGKVWDASLALIRWLAQDDDGLAGEGTRFQHWVDGKHVLELGSGTGILGLALAASSSLLSMTMTDLPEVVPLLELNVALNRVMGGSCAAPPQGDGVCDGACEFLCAPLPWGDTDAADRVLEKRGPPDTILLSDVAYFPELYRPLVRSLINLSPPGTRPQVLLAHRTRGPEPAGNNFFEILGEHFDIEQLPALRNVVREPPSERAVPSVPPLDATAQGNAGGDAPDGDGDGWMYDIQFFRFQRRSQLPSASVAAPAEPA